MDTDDGKRPDLVFYEKNKVVIGDIRITLPQFLFLKQDQRIRSLNKDRELGHAASRREKENIYDATCANNGSKFQTIIFESIGRIEKSCEILQIKALKKKKQKVVIQS